MAFFGYFKKGIQINMLKGDVIEEVASDEGAFLPGLVILLLPYLLLGLLLFLLMGMVMGMPAEESSNPELAMAMKMYGGIFKGMSVSLIFLLPLGALVGELISVGIMHLFAKLLKGEGSFMDYFQTICVATIIAWVACVLSVIPIVGMLNLLIGLWFIVVLVVITARVHKFGYGKAAAAVLLPVIILGVLMAAVFLMMLMPLMMHGGAQPM